MINTMLISGNRPDLNEPIIEKLDNGFLIKSKNINCSVGWRNIDNKKWEVYDDEIIETKNDFEICVFKPGYKTIYKKYLFNYKAKVRN